MLEEYVSKELIASIKIAVLEDMEKDTKFCKNYGILPSKDLKDNVQYVEVVRYF